MSVLPNHNRSYTVLLSICLIGAPLAETIEQALSPLTGGTTADDFAAIAGSADRFAMSVMIGLLGTALLLPALLGLARLGSERSPVIALFAAIAAGVSSLGFAGVRMAQAFELQLATGGLPPTQAVVQFDAALTTPVAMTMTVAFLGGTVVGVVLLGIALWRSHRVPIASIVLLLLFPVVDLVAPQGIGTVASHALLLVAFGWMAAVLLRSAPAKQGSHLTPAATSSS